MHTSAKRAGLVVTCIFAHMLASRCTLLMRKITQRGEDVGEEVCEPYRVSHLVSWCAEISKRHVFVRLLSMPVCGGGTCPGEIS